MIKKIINIFCVYTVFKMREFDGVVSVPRIVYAALAGLVTEVESDE